MRLLFLLLLLANVAAFGYIRYTESRAGADSQLALLQISPEKLKLLKPTVAPVPQADRAAAARPPVACLEWGAFGADDVARASAALARLELGDRVSQRDGGGEGYWVYIPPPKTRAEADRKAAELKSLGISDFFIVPDNEPWRNAIALGVFKSEDAANNWLAQLKQKGVRSAVAGPRGASSNTFLIRDPGDAVAARIAALKADFPAATLKAIACPDTPAAGNS